MAGESKEEPWLDAQLGYSQVDDQPDTAKMLACMDEHATWPAVRQLRAWEREQLALQPGERVLDVGCGLGDVALAHARQVAPDGKVVGVDASAAMVEAAHQRAAEAGLEADFRLGDATSLDEPDASFDACRSERVLQWLPDPSRAVAEMVRVLRPGGRLCLIDTDFRTMAVDVPDAEAAFAVSDALWKLRGASSSVGSRLLNLCRDQGLVGPEVVAATHIWHRWDPETENLFDLASAVEQVIEAGVLDAELGHRFLDQFTEAAKADRFFMAVTMFAVAARIPR